MIEFCKTNLPSSCSNDNLYRFKGVLDQLFRHVIIYKEICCFSQRNLYQILFKSKPPYTFLDGYVIIIMFYKQEKDKEIQIKNIYANRARAPHRLPASYGGTPHDTPPPKARKRAPSLQDLTPREKVKQYEEKRREEQQKQREVCNVLTREIMHVFLFLFIPQERKEKLARIVEVTQW